MFTSPPSSQENLKVVSKRRGTVFQNEHHPSIQLGDKVNKYKKIIYFLNIDFDSSFRSYFSRRNNKVCSI